MRKLIYIFLTILVLCTALYADARSNALKMNFKTGMTQTIYLSEYPVITLENTDIKITTGSTSVSYPLSDIRNYEFYVDENSVEEIAAKVDYVRDGDVIVVSSEAGDVTATITSAAGYVMDSRTGKTVTFDISAYQQGVYLLTVDGSTTKIVKQ